MRGRRIHRWKEKTVTGVTLYRSELDDIADLMRERINDPSVKTEEYDFESYTAFRANSREQRPATVALSASGTREGISRSLSVRFDKEGATIGSIVGPDLEVIAVAQAIEGKLRRRRRYIRASPKPNIRMVSVFIPYTAALSYIIAHQPRSLDALISTFDRIAVALVVLVLLSSWYAISPVFRKSIIIRDKEREEDTWFATEALPIVSVVIAAVAAIAAVIEAAK
jgi:hypothetical protein